MKTIKNFITENIITITSTLVGLFFLIFLLYWVLFMVLPSSTMSESDKLKIDSLNSVIQKINEHQNLLENKIKIINNEVDKIDENISKIKTNKEKVGKKYHEEINRVDKFTDPELDSFFTNRYK